jgi:hypothetical protein
VYPERVENPSVRGKLRRLCPHDVYTDAGCARDRLIANCERRTRRIARSRHADLKPRALWHLLGKQLTDAEKSP